MCSLYPFSECNISVMSQVIEEVKNSKRMWWNSRRRTQTQEITQLKQTVVELKENNTGLTQEITQLKENNTGLTQEITQLKENNTGLTQEITQLKENVVELKENNTGLTQEITQLKENNTGLTQEITQLKEKNTDSRNHSAQRECGGTQGEEHRLKKSLNSNRLWWNSKRTTQD